MTETKLKKFEPMSKLAMITVEDLLKRQGKLVIETKTYVEIKRMNSIAHIDQWGRVEWRQE